LFIVGANRSGTTLLRLLLNAHSSIAIPDEINYFYGFTGTEVCYEKWPASQLSPTDYESFVDRFLEANRPKVRELDLEAVRSEILAGPHDLRRPYQVLLERWAAHYGKARWGEKTPGNIYHSNILIDMFPDARFIHVVRDPRGGVASMQRVSFFSNDVAFNALNRHKIMTHGRDWLARAVPAAQRMEVRYEDLVTDPQHTLGRICDFVGVSYEPEMLRFHQHADRFMLDEAASTYNTTATRPIAPEQAQKWRSQLTDEDIAIIERVCADEMAEFGYPLTNPRLSWTGTVRLWVKWTYWAVQWRRHRFDRHFVILTPMFSGVRRRLRALRTAFRTQWRRAISVFS
jgi:hypothetical protein